MNRAACWGGGNPEGNTEHNRHAAMLVLIAWADSEVYRFGPRAEFWGFAFELIEGASGFHSQSRLHGFCGFPSDVEPEPEDTPAILAVCGTSPAQLRPYVDQILTSYRTHLRSMGLACA